jgi:CubicO group peptidase (beta-lactamase class C family)
VTALDRTATWPVPNVSAAVVAPSGLLASVGDGSNPYRLASIAKVLTGWATMIAVEEGIVSLDQPVGQPGCTLRHLLSHAGGYGFDGEEPISRPGVRRNYSNTGIELAAAAVADAAGMPFDRYLAEAVFTPLGMTSSALRGSPAHAVWSTLDDLVRFAGELLRPRLLAPESAAEVSSVQFPTVAGIIPGLGRFDPCPWGLGCEIRGTKSPHWTGRSNSPDTFGHFGGAGTILWVDPRARSGEGLACVALTDRIFDEWEAEALRLWPELSDAVLDEFGGVIEDRPTR